MVDSFPLMVPGAKTDQESMVWAPFDGAEIANVAISGGDVVDRALDKADRLYRNRDGWLSAEKRIEVLEKTAEIMGERFEHLAIEAAREGGKPLPDSQVEVARAIDGVKLCIETLRTQHGSEIPMGLNASSMNRLAMTTHEPIGVVVGVSAFNHPLNLIFHQVAPAVAVGCPCIIKPAEVTPLSCIRFVEILREAGLPEEWCQVVITADRETSQKLVTDARVGFFSFIGSPRVGWMLRSHLAPGTRCALEHGGAAPVIVAEDANQEAVMPLLAKGGFYHAGQVCVSVQRVFAHESIAREVADKIGAPAVKMPVGDPTLATTEIGPLIRTAECDRVAEWIGEAVSGGAEIVVGGNKVSDSCHEATVLFDPPADANVTPWRSSGRPSASIPTAIWTRRSHAPTRCPSLSSRRSVRRTSISPCGVSGNSTPARSWSTTIRPSGSTGCRSPGSSTPATMSAASITRCTTCRSRRCW